MKSKFGGSESQVDHRKLLFTNCNHLHDGTIVCNSENSHNIQ